MNRGIWFLAGAGAGIYAVVRARRAAEAFTPDGLRDRVAGAMLGAQLFGEEVRQEMTSKEAELRERLGMDEDTQQGRRLTTDRPLELTRKGNS
jgi:hypothetical protein